MATILAARAAERQWPRSGSLEPSGSALDPERFFLQKPFTPDTLTRTVREMLETTVGVG